MSCEPTRPRVSFPPYHVCQNRQESTLRCCYRAAAKPRDNVRHSLSSSRAPGLLLLCTVIRQTMRTCKTPKIDYIFHWKCPYHTDTSSCAIQIPKDKEAQQISAIHNTLNVLKCFLGLVSICFYVFLLFFFRGSSYFFSSLTTPLSEIMVGWIRLKNYEC